ncbi:phosphotransferase [Nocardioides sp. J2M5]|uniref:phosphotransferase family protein n=1 Tax=Nocardioides palaemonis TaxID=2829810 RepID=UPI001BAAEBFA|nr:phosphotransferase [Nocardioides palaemonis]MBS2940269.1 phosphotransferase [Nocardioides palaemonis]
MEEVEVVVAHRERATLRVGDVFLKVDGEPSRTRRELEAMRLAPVPTAPVLWHTPPVVALGRLRGVPLGRLGVPDTSPAAAWSAAGAMVRALHDAPLPLWPSPRRTPSWDDLAVEARSLVADGLLPADLVERNLEVARAALRPHDPVFTHGDLQTLHVFVEGDSVTGVLDWSEAGPGDATYDLAVLTLGHEDRLDDVLAGYGGGVDVDAITGWWSARSLLAARWLLEHGFDPDAPGCEFDVLRARM